MREALERGEVPLRFGMCNTCQRVMGLAFTGHKSAIRCTHSERMSSRMGMPNTCRGTVHLPGDPEVQASAEVAFRLGGPEAARPIIQAYFDRYVE